jgi:hypothetical protein
MTVSQHARRSLVAAAGALVGFAVLVSVAAAAFAAPFVAYGSGATPGAAVTAFIGTTQVGSATVTADGAWVIQIQQASHGDVIRFQLNGVAQQETLIAQEGGAPGGGLNASVSAATGLVLTPVPTSPTPPAPPVLTLVTGLNPTTYGPGSLSELQAQLLASGAASVTLFVGGGYITVPAIAPAVVLAALNIPAGYFDTARFVLVVKLN